MICNDISIKQGAKHGFLYKGNIKGLMVPLPRMIELVLANCLAVIVPFPFFPALLLHIEIIVEHLDFDYRLRIE